MKMIDTPTHGVLPVLDVWKQCRHTKTGWTGVNEQGQRVNIGYRPEERDFGPARMPDRDHVVLTRDAAAHHGDINRHVSEGVILIERCGADQCTRSRVNLLPFVVSVQAARRWRERLQHGPVRRMIGVATCSIRVARSAKVFPKP